MFVNLCRSVQFVIESYQKVPFVVVVVVVVVVVFKLIHIGFTHLVAIDFKISKRGQYVKTQKYCLCLFIYFFSTYFL